MADHSLKCYTSRGGENLNRHQSFELMGEAQIEKSQVPGDALFLQQQVAEGWGSAKAFPAS